MQVHTCAWVRCASGFESSAPAGEGLGIDPFRPRKSTIKLSNKMFLPEEAVERLKEQVRTQWARCCAALLMCCRFWWVNALCPLCVESMGWLRG